jgi:hypothetical protein
VKSPSATIAALIGATLFVTNPSQDDYITWLREQVASSRSAAPKPCSISLAPIINASTTRENFFLLSVFSTPLDAANRFQAVGLGRYFFVPRSPTPIEGAL